VAQWVFRRGCTLIFWIVRRYPVFLAQECVLPQVNRFAGPRDLAVALLPITSLVLESLSSQIEAITYQV
jgi:hypothetical protein